MQENQTVHWHIGKEDDASGCAHPQAFQEHDLRWPPEWGAAYAQKTAGVSRRQRELIFFLEQIHKADLDVGIMHAAGADTNFSIAWCRARRKVTPCTGCLSRIWGLTLGREVPSKAHLALQGSSHAAQGDTIHGIWALKQLVGLAGNAGMVSMAWCWRPCLRRPWLSTPGGPTRLRLCRAACRAGGRVRR